MARTRIFAIPTPGDLIDWLLALTLAFRQGRIWRVQLPYPPNRRGQFNRRRQPNPGAPETPPIHKS